MNRLERKMQSEHAAAFEILPWYINGTLRGSEIRRVEQHLTSCVVCRSELAYQREMAGLVATSEDFPVSPEHGLQEVMDRIDAEESWTSTRGGPIARRIRRLRRSWQQISPGVRGALLAQAAAILLLVGLATTSGVFRTGRGAPEPEYRTLSDDAAQVADSRLLLHLVFAPDATDTEVGSLVAGIGGEIVGGPSPLGVYTVAVTLPGDGSVTPESLLGQLREQDVVVFAERASLRGAVADPDGSSDPAAYPTIDP